MGDGTGISWTDATWNPVKGCSRVSEGCRNCYAEVQAARIVRMGKGKPTPYDGLVKLVRVPASPASRSLGSTSESRWTGVVAFDARTLAAPLRWSKPRRIFVNSMSDLFHESLTNEQIAAVFGVMAACPQHTFQCLTKRSARMKAWFDWMASRVTEAADEWSGRDCGMTVDDASDACILEYLDETATAALAGHFDACHLGLTTSTEIRWPLPNVHLGVSVENQAAADERIPDLLATPAAVRFLSCEPLLGGLDIRPFLWKMCASGIDWISGSDVPDEWEARKGLWVIVGCESGPGARPCDVAWLRSLRDQCVAASVAFFLKQASPWDEGRQVAVAMGVGFGSDSKRKTGGIIELPYLDGVQHAAFPVTP